MGVKDSTAVTRHIRALFGAGAAGGANDGQLLERFRERGGDPDAEAAFAVLVARHGPMVLGVCRRALRDPDAADAFQATFLVLVKKAGSVRVGDSLGRWLYGVSRRVAARARVEAARRAAREGPGTGPEPEGPEDDPERRELLAALDEEVARLPEPFRAAVVLCDLGGLTHETAAGQLGCPVGTIESRLSRGRKRLRERLTRRGLAPAVAGALDVPSPSVPEALSSSTVAIATRGASVSVTVSTLIEGVIVDMFRTKLKTLALGLGAAVVACGVGGIAAVRPKADGEPKELAARPAVAPEKPPEAAALRLEPPARIQPGDLLRVEVLEALPGRPITGERLVRPDGTISLDFYGDIPVAGLTRHEVKVKVIEHLRKFLPDEILGLTQFDPKTEKPVEVAPADSDRVFVDDDLNLYPAAILKRRRGDEGDKLDRILRAVETLKFSQSRGGATAPEAARLADHERRLAEVEAKIDRLIRKMKSPEGKD